MTVGGTISCDIDPGPSISEQKSKNLSNESLVITGLGAKLEWPVCPDVELSACTRMELNGISLPSWGLVRHPLIR